MNVALSQNAIRLRVFYVRFSRWRSARGRTNVFREKNLRREKRGTREKKKPNLAAAETLARLPTRSETCRRLSFLQSKDGDILNVDRH